MKWFWEREAKTAVPLVALSDLAAAQWSNGGALAREGFERNAIAYRCVRLIAEAAASVPLRVSEADGALAGLMARPNREQAGPDLLESFYGHLTISGDAFIEAVRLDGEVRELFVLRPDRMKAIMGARGYPNGWEHRVGSSVRKILREADGFLPVMHLKLFHPADDYRGHAPLQAAARAVDVHNAGGAWAKALMDNAARPSGALVYTGPEGAENLSAEQFDRLKGELAELYSGAANAGRPMVLDGGLDWRAMSLSPAEMDFQAAKNAAAREIALAFGVPPMLLGIPGDNTYSNYREANLAFFKQTVLPLAKKTAAALTGWLGASFAASVEIDLAGVEALAAERDALWARVSAADFLNPDEKRAALGLCSREDGDE